MSPQKRGFANLSPKERTAVASKGGLAAQASGKAHRWTPEQAKAAGSKGGKKERPSE
ncbi:MAG TPA: hypothetical protein VN697_03485 [Tepidiformaceae bacterium]|jgi:uncharacterized protein|nr:hypothetical protein [Tepidiformaceae bacterium]